jgi:hypothetical protein
MNRDCMRTWERRLATIGQVAVGLAAFTALPAAAADCRFVGGPQTGGIEPALVVDAVCTDPDYNERTLVIDSTEHKLLDTPDGSKIAYTEVKAYFPASRTQDQLPAGITQSPTTVEHEVTWRFPAKSYWRNRFFQQTYPLRMDMLNAVDARFAFTSGGYTVGINPGNPNVGYRVPAAAAKLAKAYANKLYGNTRRIYGYMYGQSGGSVQSLGAAEGTSGVWDGLIPVVIATDGLNVHSFLLTSKAAIAIPAAKRQAIAAAASTGGDIYAGLTGDERAVIDELLSAGFPKITLDSGPFRVAGSSGPGLVDPTYVDDFWAVPGYEGVNPPAWLAAAKVDGLATISSVTRDDAGTPTAILFDKNTVPALGSIGSDGLQYELYARDGVTRISSGDAQSVTGKLDGSTLNLTGENNRELLKALAAGGKIRISNRGTLAMAFYPRHTILDNGNPGYNQYRNADGTAKFVQRPVSGAYFPNRRSSGGRRQTGNLTVKTIVFENLMDPASWPYVAGFYATLVNKAIGPARAERTFRLYYQEASSHGAFPEMVSGPSSASLVSTGGILHQALLDLAAWAERGVAPLPSSRYRLDQMNQVILPAKASERFGLQQVIDLTANGRSRVEVGINQLVKLRARIEMPPRAGRITQYDWYLGGKEIKFEPATRLALPLIATDAERTVSFAAPGDYTISLRVFAQRDGIADAGSTTLLQNVARVHVIVR